MDAARELAARWIDRARALIRCRDQATFERVIDEYDYRAYEVWFCAMELVGAANVPTWETIAGRRAA